MQEYRSIFFMRLFDSIGVEYELHGDNRIANEVSLKKDGISLKLYFNEATESRGVYFAANKNEYDRYNWNKYWLFIENLRNEERHFKVIPFPGNDEFGLIDLIEFRFQKEK